VDRRRVEAGQQHVVDDEQLQLISGVLGPVDDGLALIAERVGALPHAELGVDP
jgi:hypothetical protein